MSTNGKRKVTLSINLVVSVDVPGEVFSPVGLEDVRLRKLCEGVRDRLFSPVYAAEERVCGAVNGAVQALTTEQVLYNCAPEEKDDRRVVLFSGLNMARVEGTDVLSDKNHDQDLFRRYALGKAIEEKGGSLFEQIDDLIRENMHHQSYRETLPQLKALLSSFGIEPSEGEQK